MQLFGLHIYNGKYLDFLNLIKNPDKKTLVFTPNPEIIVKASRDQEFFEILKKADYLTPDGNGLYTGSLLQEGKGYILSFFQTLSQKSELKEKYGELIKGSDLTKDLIEYAEEQGKHILMIDNYRIKNPENNFEIKKQQIQTILPKLFKDRFPRLRVTILFDGEMSSGDIAELIERENIKYIFSCIGMKTQEQRLIEIFSYLEKEQRVIGLGVGSSIDYLLGLQKRAPSFIRSMGLEWLYRLILEPRKRWRRIHTAFIGFPRLIKKQK